MVIGVVFLGMAVAIGGTHYAFGVFVEPLEEEFGWSRTEVTASLSFSSGVGAGGAVHRSGAGQVRGTAGDDHIHPSVGPDLRVTAPDDECRALVPAELRAFCGVSGGVDAGGAKAGGGTGFRGPGGG